MRKTWLETKALFNSDLKADNEAFSLRLIQKEIQSWEWTWRCMFGECNEIINVNADNPFDFSSRQNWKLKAGFDFYSISTRIIQVRLRRTRNYLQRFEMRTSMIKSAFETHPIIWKWNGETLKVAPSCRFSRIRFQSFRVLKRTLKAKPIRKFSVSVASR